MSIKSRVDLIKGRYEAAKGIPDDVGARGVAHNAKPKRSRKLVASAAGGTLPAVQDVGEIPLPPEFTALTLKQQRFVAAYIEHANGHRACREAGYGNGNGIAYNVLHNPRVIAAMAALGVAADQIAAGAVLSAIERRSILATCARDNGPEVRAHALRAIEIDARLAGDVGEAGAQAPGGASMTPDAAGEIIGRLLAGVARGVMAGGDRDNLVQPVDVRLIEAEDDE